LLLAVVSQLCSDGQQAEGLGVGDLNGHIIAESLIVPDWYPQIGLWQAIIHHRVELRAGSLPSVITLF
jgi:hypothetical protein